MSEGHFYVTTPIYYVNDKPHIGHSYTTILADVLARYHRLWGRPAWFLTGTDEHGQKVQQAAEKRKVSPQVHVDETVVRFRELWTKLEITNDDFIRTTEARHKTVVQDILQDLFDRGEIYRADYDGWYCVTCERFFPEKDITDGRCPQEGCGRTVERIREANYFFRMSRYQEWLVEYIQQNPEFIQPASRRNETLGFLRKPLNDLCISRPKSRLAWGIELPFDTNYVTYVWFDALVNYISAVGYRRDEAMFARWWPCSLHLIGKDILTTHTVYWPTMLRAMGLPMPRTVFAHGWWLSGQEKMSKSLGNAVNPMDMIARAGVDAFRYFLMAEMNLGQDASFTEDAFIRRYNADLANDLGNLLSRVGKQLSQHFGGQVPAQTLLGPADAEDTALRQQALETVRTVEARIEEMKPDQAIAAVTALIRAANKYLEVKQPWTRIKTGAREDVGRVLYHALEVLRIAAGLLFPVMPGKMAELRAALGLGNAVPDVKRLGEWGVLQPGTAVQPGVSLFPRLELPKADEAAARVEPVGQVGQVGPVGQPAGEDLITIDDFARVQLRTAKVLAAERVPGKDKLLKLRIDSGDRERQLVAGVAQHYAPEALVGKTIVILANLKPAKIGGVLSEGMLLAASDAQGLRVVTVDGEMGPGAKVK